MKIYDITQELFHGRVYPGDPGPEFNRVLKISDGAFCNLTELSLGAHNATHLDAPYHFIDQGKTIDQVELGRCIGPCSVISLSGLSDMEFAKVLDKCEKRLLIKGSFTVTLEIAKLFNRRGILLVGVESQSVGPVDSPMEVHLELLDKEVVLLEGIDLSEVPPGNYFLSAAPLKLGGCDGAPCRAVLLEFD